MAERRFTRLKASLSETAAKTRENVSRELRQSMVAEHDDDDQTDDALEQWLEAFEMTTQDDHRFATQVVAPLETRPLSADGSAFARECVRHLTRERRHRRVADDALFGSAFECFPEWRVGQGLTPTAAADDRSDAKTVVRETACVMNRMNGWLELWRRGDHCFLSFFRDRKRQQLIWTQEVTQQVAPHSAMTSALQIDCHCIEFSTDDDVSEWLRDINETRFDAHKVAARLRRDDWSPLDAFFARHVTLNPFSAFVGLQSRGGPFARLRPTAEPPVDAPEVLEVVLTSARLEVGLKDALSAKVALFDQKSGKLSAEFRFADRAANARALFRCDVSQSARADLFLVLRVEKCVHKDRDHREAFAWSARPLFDQNGELMTQCQATPLFRWDQSRQSDDAITQALSTLSTRTAIGGHFLSEVRLPADDVIEPVPLLRPPATPIARFEHALFVFPLSLKYSEQRVFSKARNLQIQIQLRDSDARDAQPMRALVAADGSVATVATSVVGRHNANPDFNEEFVVRLPLALTDKLHLLFTFHHVSCKKECTRAPVGHSWLPLRALVGQSSAVALSVFASLPTGYLSCQSLGLGKGLSMPDTRLVAKDVFRVQTRLVSSVMSRDATLEAAVDCFARINRQDNKEVSRLVQMESARKHLKSLLSSDVTELVRFSAVVFQQTLELVVHSSDADVGRAVALSVLRLVAALERRADVIAAFVDASFTSQWTRAPNHCLAEQLIVAFEAFVASVESDDQSARLLLRHVGFFLRLFAAAALDASLDAPPTPPSAEHAAHVRLVLSRVSALVARHSRSEEAPLANRAMAAFAVQLLSLFERRHALLAVWTHVRALGSRDVVVSELRLHFLATILAHQHHVLLNAHAPQTLCFLWAELRQTLPHGVRHVRQLAVQLVRNLLAKHALDTRHAHADLYLPLLELFCDHLAADARHHTRHPSLPAAERPADETRDLLVALVFVCQRAPDAHFQQMAAQRLERLLVQMVVAIDAFADDDDNPDDESRARTLPAALDVLAVDASVCRQNLALVTAVVALRTARLSLCSDPEVLGRAVALIQAVLRHQQSPAVVVHAFDHVALVAHRFPDALFAMHALFGQLVAKVVQLCDCAVKAVRDAGVDLLFRLFAANFKRTRFETIVCVSRIASNHAQDLSRFQSALTRLQLLAAADEAFASDARLAQTVQRIRDILKATHRIRTEARNPYDNSELRLFLANSYAQTSWALRRTWLENLAEVHARAQDWPEYAMCLSHVMAIVVEQLAAKGVHLDDARQHVRRVSPNIARDDSRIESDDWLETEDSSHVTAEALDALIEDCVDSLEKCQMFELAPHALKVMLQHFERRSDHKRLSGLYARIGRMHARALEANASGRRLFDTYFRVAHFGALNQEYVYREGRAVSLAEMTQKLQRLHPNATIVSDCDSDCVTDSAIVVTHVTPDAPNARTDFERHVGVDRFVFEQRVRTEGGQGVRDQHKRRVQLRTSHWFPFCVKRVPVVERHETVLSPIEVAIDEMEARVDALERVTRGSDVKHLQLVLQGSVQTQVHSGPLAYADAFLADADDGPLEERLRAVFAQFVAACERALRLNERLIKQDQQEYQRSLWAAFERFRQQLDLKQDPKRTSVQIFDVISGSSLA